MLQYLSTMYEKTGFTVELIPLAPGHAFNRSDASIAHMNTFNGKLKRRAHVFGAEGTARAFHVATDPRFTCRRNLMLRRSCLFRVVPDNPAAKSQKKNLGEQIINKSLDKGHMGVRGFLYFDFSFPARGMQQGRTHPPGYAMVRQHADASMDDNPTMVWTWLKDLAKLMCQACSDREEYPVTLLAYGCSKKRCAKAAAAPAIMREVLPLDLANSQPDNGGGPGRAAPRAAGAAKKKAGVAPRAPRATGAAKKKGWCGPTGPAGRWCGLTGRWCGPTGR
jgi:hypothetical protein